MSDFVERLRDIGLSKVACGDSGDDFFDAANAVEAERALADDLATMLNRFSQSTWHPEGYDALLARWHEARQQ